MLLAALFLDREANCNCAVLKDLSTNPVPHFSKRTAGATFGELSKLGCLDLSHPLTLFLFTCDCICLPWLHIDHELLIAIAFDVHCDLISVGDFLSWHHLEPTVTQQFHCGGLGLKESLERSDSGRAQESNEIGKWKIMEN